MVVYYLFVYTRLTEILIGNILLIGLIKLTNNLYILIGHYIYSIYIIRFRLIYKPLPLCIRYHDSQQWYQSHGYARIDGKVIILIYVLFVKKLFFFDKRSKAFCCSWIVM